MNIVQKRDSKKLTLILEGRLDSTTAPELDDSIADILFGAEEVVFDITKLEYISSAGLRVILRAHKIMSTQGTLKIAGANESVKEVFYITGLEEILDIE